jgi:branched-subunit amino acid aminotransferase/4-amino-4-deoxychorismate lyase
MQQLLVADSFRVRKNQRTGLVEARGLALHLERFRTSVERIWQELGHADESREALNAFLRRSLAQISEYGDGWPRLELGRDAGSREVRLNLQLRETPQLHETISLRSAGPVSLVHPERKGANIAQFAKLNRELGAEALITDQSGDVLEGATTSLVWWPLAPSPSTALGRIVRSAARVPSVTEQLLSSAQDAFGSPLPRLQPQNATVAELLRHEVWAVNALHGISVVTAIDGVTLAAPDGPRLHQFREALDRTWQPVAAQQHLLT